MTASRTAATRAYSPSSAGPASTGPHRRRVRRTCSRPPAHSAAQVRCTSVRPEPTSGVCSGAGWARRASATITAPSGQSWHAGRRERAHTAASRKALTSSRASLPSREAYSPPTSICSRLCGTRFPVETTEASPRAATKPATAVYGLQLRGASAVGAPGSERVRRPTNHSPTGTHSARNTTARSSAMPPVPGASASPVPCSAAAGPSRGIRAARPTRTRTVTARPTPGRRIGSPASAASGVGRVKVTPGSSPGTTEPGKSRETTGGTAFRPCVRLLSPP